MMGPSPWYVELNEEDGKLYIFKNGSRMKAEGNYKDGERPFISYVLNARRHLSEDGKLYIVFQVPRGSPQPKALRTDVFRWDANDITRLLRKGDFCDQWNQHVATNMSRDGKVDIDAILKSGNKDKDAQPAGSTSRKRPAASAQSNSSSGESSKRPKTATGNDDLDMDKIIKDHFLGQFTVPVKCLVEPHHSRLIRQPYEPHIKGLKEEMRLNPTCDVAPIVAQVLLREGQKFDEAHPEAFKYETLGGNHTRIALTQLLEEDKELASLPYYRARLVSIYAWLSTEQAQHLALRHNRATEYTNKLTTQDQVQICRLRLYSLAERDLSEEPPEKTTKWRQSCIATLMMTKKQLDERMIYFLAGLPNMEYNLLQQVFALYEDGKLVKVPKAKLGMVDTKMDCRGSNFKGLRNLDIPTINDVLSKIINKEIEFTSLGSTCKEIKKIRSLKDEFIRLVGVSSWETAQESYPGYANEGVFKRKFDGIPFAKDMPAMVSFCQKAMRTTSVVPRDMETLTNIVSFQSDGESFCVAFLPLPATSLTYGDVEKLIPNFSGFSLAIFHLSPSGDIAEVEDVSRMCKAVNTAAHRSGFTLLISMSEKLLGTCMEMLEKDNYTVLVCYIKTEETKGNHATLLKPVVKPFILAFNNLEAIKPLLNFSADRGNLFTCPTLADFTQEMVTMVATKGDHVLLINCCADEVISALRMERNTYVVGKDVQRMQSRVIKEMSKGEDENEKESDDNGEEDEKTD